MPGMIRSIQMNNAVSFCMMENFKYAKQTMSSTAGLLIVFKLIFNLTLSQEKRLSATGCSM